MKNKKLLAIGMCGAFCLSLVCFTHANAQDTHGAVSGDTETTIEDIFFQDTDGGMISTDGENWVSQSDYEKNNPTSKVEWWTADEYEMWIIEQRHELEALIGTDNVWYDGQGVPHEFTQESVNAIINEYQKTLDNIKSGTMYSKDSNDGDSYAMFGDGQFEQDESDTIY